MENNLAYNKVYLRIIFGISIAIPIAVAFLILVSFKISIMGEWVRSLPNVHAIINSVTVVALVGAFISVKNGNIKAHRSFMFIALFLGVLFLISYILYHSSVESVKFGDIDHDGELSVMELDKVSNLRLVYLTILVSHILLSIVVVPFVLLAFYFALTNQIQKHKRMVKYTFPVWMYVSVTGVVVYFMITPYYV